jgi:hypothetical protein
MESVRGSYDITYAKFGVWRYGARGRSGPGGCCRVGTLRSEFVLIDDTDGTGSGG